MRQPSIITDTARKRELIKPRFTIRVFNGGALGLTLIARRVQVTVVFQMNIHHLELFYYVARYGGISRAVRHIPYGIQQPAVSSQILQLEEGLDAKLFERTPFRLTEEGKILFAFVRPFFEKLGEVSAQITKRAATQLRIGASELVLRDHLPVLMQRVRKKQPGLRLAMQAGLQHQLEADIKDRKLDLAIVTVLQSKIGAGLRKLPLIKMPLVLVVHRDSPIKCAEELWTKRKIEEPLICFSASEPSFQKGLKRRRIEWIPTIQTSSTQLVTSYVGNKYGIGVSVDVPEVLRHNDVRSLPLDGFNPVEIVCVWQGRPSALVKTVLEESLNYCREHWPLLTSKGSVDA